MHSLCSKNIVPKRPKISIIPSNITDHINMADILEKGQLSVLSQLLRVRLANRAIMDVNIVDWQLLLRPIKLDNYHGRFVGTFIRRPNGAICFLLLIRGSENGNFDVVMAWYVNQELYKIPESDKEWFLWKVAGVPQLGVVMVKTNLIKCCYPFTLLRAIEITIGLHLVTNF